MFVEIPPKVSISSFMGFLKGKSSVIIYSRWGNMKYKYRNRSFWRRGYYVDMVGKNEIAIRKYISVARTISLIGVREKPLAMPVDIYFILEGVLSLFL